MMCHSTGRLPTSTSGLGRNSVSSRRRVPCPPQRITTCMEASSRLASAVAVETLDLAAQHLDLLEEDVVLFHLPAEKLVRQLHLRLHPLRRQGVHIGGLVPAVLEGLRLHPALGDERAHAVVDLPDADTQFPRQIALTGIWMLFEKLQQPIADFVGDLRYVQALNAIRARLNGGGQPRCSLIVVR